MLRFLSTTVIFILAWSLWATFSSAWAAGSSTPQTLSQEVLSSEKECQISEAARDAIAKATDAAIKDGKISIEALDVIDRAEAIAGPPECDSDRAIQLTVTAINIANTQAQNYEVQGLSDSTTTSNRFSDKNSMFIEGGFRMGSEKVRISEQNCVDIFFQEADCPRGFRIGEGVHLAIGFNYFIGDSNSQALSLAAGYLKGGDFEEKSSATTLEVLYTQYNDLHRWGIGLSYHIDPEYEEEISSSKTRKLKFDDALGIVIKYGYLIRSPDWELGFRLTLMDYKLASEDYNANSLGIFASKSFL